MSEGRMTPLERRASTGLAAIFGLRMLGLFLILPVFAIYAETLPGGHDHTLIGLALGIYGLTQAALQLPFGMASDRFGRKRVIYVGLAIFAVGSFIAAFATDLHTIILGRAIQGAGAISAAVTALTADLTREEHRTKAMAMIGSTIGLAFAFSLVAGPALAHYIGVPGLFAVTGALACVGILVVYALVPNPTSSAFHSDAEVASGKLSGVLRNPQLLRLNFGILTLHMVQMAMFIVVPLSLKNTVGLAQDKHWMVYLPVLLGSFLVMVPAIIYGEKRMHLKQVFIGAILVLLIAQAVPFSGLSSLTGIVSYLLLFFIAFNILEASLPSLISKIAPAGAKGTAMGVYNTSQSLGLFIGGAGGGYLFTHWGAHAVFAASAVLIVGWLLAAFTMAEPPAVRSKLYHVGPMSDEKARALSAALAAVAGVTEAVVVPDEGVAYLKVAMAQWDEQNVVRLIEGGI